MEQKLESEQHRDEPKIDLDKPPIFKSWKMWYISLLIYLAALITIFTLFTRAFE
jgi:hypothetical protein